MLDNEVAVEEKERLRGDRGLASLADDEVGIGEIEGGEDL